MSRLIDADALEEKLRSVCRLARTDAQKALMGRVMYILNNMPVIDDVEQVTRCRDCRWYDAGHNEVDAWQRCRVLKIETHDDFFCANGERDDVHRE